MPTTITITLEETLTEEQHKVLQYVLSDALYEFTSGPRRNATEYVEKQYAELYPQGEPLSPERIRHVKKINEVELRCALARLMWDAALRTLKVE